ncbi:BnaA07g03900D [Brassica napus]|uniref:BnaA07g03900D protein n=1 Tax=Brassica napus TaxID=3708 RepID=A0A078H3M5_BRANA|nr:BnaA07g03900D [Brassica napus]
MELSRHELGLEYVVFEPGGELGSHRNKIKMIEKESAATTFDFVDFSPSDEKFFYVSAQQEFHYKTNWRMFPTQSWIQQTRQRSKGPPDHQVITCLAKHVGLDHFQETIICDWVGRWRPGKYVSILIILVEHSARKRIGLGPMESEDSPFDQIKLWKPPDLQQIQHNCRDYQTRSGDGEFTRGNGETVLTFTLFEKKESSYETTCPTFLVLPTSTRNQFEAETNSGLQITDSTTMVNLHLLYSELFQTWRPDLEHMSAYLSALVNTLLIRESAWAIRSWKIVLSTKSSYGSHQICNNFSTIAEIIKPGVEMENSLEEMEK